MAEFEIGDVTLSVGAQGLTLRPRNQPDLEIRFDADGVSELLDLLRIASEHIFSQRQGFRVPIRSSSTLDTTLRIGAEEAFAVTARNVSLTGIFVELRPDEPHELTLDLEVEVVMDFERKTVSAHGIVRRHEAGGYGIFFVESVRGEELNPPPALVRLVRKLEARWLAES